MNIKIMKKNKLKCKKRIYLFIIFCFNLNTFLFANDGISLIKTDDLFYNPTYIDVSSKTTGIKTYLNTEEINNYIKCYFEDSIFINSQEKLTDNNLIVKVDCKVKKIQKVNCLYLLPVTLVPALTMIPFAFYAANEQSESEAPKIAIMSLGVATSLLALYALSETTSALRLINASVLNYDIDISLKIIQKNSLIKMYKMENKYDIKQYSLFGEQREGKEIERMIISEMLSRMKGELVNEREIILAQMNENNKNDDIVVETNIDIDNIDIEHNIPISKSELNLNNIAVIICAQNYENAPKVDYAKRDGVIMKEYLLKTFGFSEENVFVLVDPTKSDFEKMFGIRNNEKGQLYRCVKPNESDVFIFYAGHGAPDLKTKEGYLLPVEADPSYIELQGYPLSLLYENLNKLPAKSIITVLDACFSGGYDKGMIVKSASPMVLGTIDEQIELNDNITVITSSKGDEVSSWYPDMKHGLFTYYFLKGIKGDADKNGNREITLKELKDYVVEEVSYRAMRLHNRIQTPVFKGDDNKVIVRVK